MPLVPIASRVDTSSIGAKLFVVSRLDVCVFPHYMFRSVIDSALKRIIKLTITFANSEYVDFLSLVRLIASAVLSTFQSASRTGTGTLVRKPPWHSGISKRSYTLGVHFVFAFMGSTLEL